MSVSSSTVPVVTLVQVYLIRSCLIGERIKRHFFIVICLFSVGTSYTKGRQRGHRNGNGSSPGQWYSRGNGMDLLLTRKSGVSTTILSEHRRQVDTKESDDSIRRSRETVYRQNVWTPQTMTRKTFLSGGTRNQKQHP